MDFVEVYMGIVNVESQFYSDLTMNFYDMSTYPLISFLRSRHGLKNLHNLMRVDW